MLTITELEIREREYPMFRDRNRAYRAYVGKPRCYVHPEGETVLENFFIGRRARPFELYKLEVVPAVKAALVDYLVEQGRGNYDVDEGDIELRWSRKAGCSCGCSPGFIVTLREGLLNKPIDIWVTVKATDGGDGAAVVPEAQSALEDVRSATQRTGRSGSGNLRNFKAMSDRKFLQVHQQVILENNDPEAIEAMRTERARRCD